MFLTVCRTFADTIFFSFLLHFKLHKQQKKKSLPLKSLALVFQSITTYCRVALCSPASLSALISISVSLLKEGYLQGHLCLYLFVHFLTSLWAFLQSNVFCFYFFVPGHSVFHSATAFLPGGCYWNLIMLRNRGGLQNHYYVHCKAWEAVEEGGWLEFVCVCVCMYCMCMCVFLWAIWPRTIVKNEPLILLLSFYITSPTT